MKPDLTWLPNETAFSAAMGDASVHIGGKNPNSKFVPNVNMGKFGDEAWVNMNAHNVKVINEKQVVEDGKVSLTVGNETHRYYSINNDDFEVEVEFSERPVSDDYEYKIDMSVGVEAYKQLITQEEYDAGNRYTRPDAEGSYAFYCNKKNGKYKTGKVAHIYRPKLIDALGAEAWCDMGLQGNILTITMPTESLDTMTYPVILDPVLGYSSAGALTTAVNTFALGVAHVTDTVGGVISSFHAALATIDTDPNHTIKVGILNINQGTDQPNGLPVVEQVEMISAVSDDVNMAASGSGVLLPSTRYLVAFQTRSNVTTVKYDNGSVIGSWYYVGGYAPALVDPSPTYVFQASNYLLSLWVEYEAAKLAGGGLASDDSVMFLASGGSSEL